MRKSKSESEFIWETEDRTIIIADTGIEDIGTMMAETDTTITADGNMDEGDKF
ncbi:MAG TPA: hypothetical protein VN371_06690 [Chlorobaculum sp.]|nr:hypothetical protein [Chlorobaculum sp.]